MEVVFLFSMGPIGSPLSKIGVQVTDSSYVLLSMRIMTRVSSEIWKHLRADEEFVKCLHSFGKRNPNDFFFRLHIRMSSGVPRPTAYRVINNWPCNPEKTLVDLFFIAFCDKDTFSFFRLFIFPTIEK